METFFSKKYIHKDPIASAANDLAEDLNLVRSELTTPEACQLSVEIVKSAN